ncbi:MAG: YdcF family protein [Lachnospiraceae bacterium]|nr:YdcF family protein [Lachnospiraceae bacterium]
MKTFKKIVKIFAIVIGAVVLVVIVFTMGINAFVRLSTKNRIIDADEAADLTDVDCIIVLGASVKPGNTPSLMLSDRLDRAVELYKSGVAPKIIMSGDHGSKYYNEVQVMKDYAIAKGVPSEDIFMDHAGFSTYDTMYRAKEIFGAKKVVIVTQRYHLYRSVYVAKSLGMDAYGVAAKDARYNGQTKRDFREIVAVDKDFIWSLFKFEPIFMGEKIPLNQSGDVTNDQGGDIIKDSDR